MATEKQHEVYLKGVEYHLIVPDEMLENAELEIVKTWLNSLKVDPDCYIAMSNTFQINNKKFKVEFHFNQDNKSIQIEKCSIVE